MRTQPTDWRHEPRTLVDGRLPVLRDWYAGFLQDACDKALTQVQESARPWFWREFWEGVLFASDRYGDSEAEYELLRLALEAHLGRNGGHPSTLERKALREARVL